MVNKPPYARDEKNRPLYRPGRGPRPPGHRGRSLIPLMIFGSVALFIASREIPWLKDRINALVAPAQQSAIELCREAALDESPQPEFARLIRRGEATATQNGYLIDHLVLGEMSTDKGEQRIAVTCHVSSDGALVNLHREPMKTLPSTPTVDSHRSSGPPTK